MSSSDEVVEVPPRTFDLDAARAARREAKGDVEPPTVTVDGVVYDLPAELPVGALSAFGAIFAVAGSDDGDRVNLEALGSLEEAASSLFGDTWPVLKAKNLSFEDLTALLDFALGAYGIDLPN